MGTTNLMRTPQKNTQYEATIFELEIQNISPSIQAGASATFPLM